MQQLNHDLAPIAIVKHESPEVAALDRRLETLRAAVVINISTDGQFRTLILADSEGAQRDVDTLYARIKPALALMTRAAQG
jgi:hypothetical protein